MAEEEFSTSPLLSSPDSERTRKHSRARLYSKDFPVLEDPVVMDSNEDPPDAASRPSVLTGAAGYIIITEFCERLAYNSFAGSLVLFFQTQLHYSNAEADIQFSIWSGICYVTPLLGGYIADSYLGRYWTTLLFCLFYLAGLVMVVLGSIPGHVTAAFIFVAMYIIAIGTGGIKPNVCTLGADQFDNRYSKDRKEKESFFNWFYWSINLGTFFAFTFVAYICQYGIPGLVAASWGFFVGYLIPAVSMGLAVLVFVLGSGRHTIREPSGSVLVRTVQICYDAVKSAVLQLLSNGPASNKCRPCKISSSSGIEKQSSFGKNPLSTPQYTLMDAHHFLDRAKKDFGGNYSSPQVESVKLVTRLGPFLLAMVPYWGIYSQMSTAFQNQGCQMDLYLGKFTIPVSALQLFNTLAVLLLVPVFDKVIYPALQTRGFRLRMLTKIGWGFFLAMLGMLVAAGVEEYRIELAPIAGNYSVIAARDNITPCQSIDDFNPELYQQWFSNQADVKPMYCFQTCGTITNATLDLGCISCDDIPQMSRLSVFWQVPQFVLLGMSEILASITALEFFYSQAPVAMRSVSQSLNLVTNALGTFAVIPILLLVNLDKDNEWVPANLDTGRLSYYFVILAICMAFSMLYLVFISVGYEYRNENSVDPLEADGSDAGAGTPTTKPKTKRNSGSSNSTNSSQAGNITDIFPARTARHHPALTPFARSDSVSSTGSSRDTVTNQVDSRRLRGFSETDFSFGLSNGISESVQGLSGIQDRSRPSMYDEFDYTATAVGEQPLWNSPVFEDQEQG